MKIVQIIPFFAPAWGFGGPVRVCLNISTGLVKRGHDVTVLTTDAYDYRKRIDKVCEEIGGIKVLRFRNISNRLAKRFNLYLPLNYKKYLLNNISNYDVVHLHAFFTYQNIVAARICRKNNIPYVLHLHESPIPKTILGKVFIKKIFNFFYGRKILCGASRIFTLTSAEKSDLISNYPNLKNKVEVVFNGIDARKINRFNRCALRAKFGFRSEDKIILSLSRLAKIKRIDLLIQAFNELRKYDTRYRLLIVGPDESGTKKSLVKIINNLGLANKIKFIGAVSGRRKEEVFAASDIFALFSDYESFSLTTLEALQSGLPLCLSKNVGLARDLKKYSVCMVVDTVNLKKCATALHETYNQKNNLLKNRYAALDKFKNKNIVKDIERVYKKVV